MTRRFAALLAIAAALVSLDQWTKRWASASLAHRGPMNVLGEVVRLTYTRNSGVAFGLGSGTHFPYYLFSIAAAIAIVLVFLRRPNLGHGRRFALALIFGGAIGNLIDRLSSGEVVDFIEIGYGRWHWPVFNVADSAVSIGVVLFALQWSRHGGAASAGADEHDLEGTAHAGGSDGEAAGAGASGGGTAGPVPREGAGEPLA